MKKPPDSDIFQVFFPIFEHKINVSDELYDYWILRFAVVFPAKSFYKKIHFDMKSWNITDRIFFKGHNI